MIRFFVEGIPAPQGSKRHLGNGILVESSKRVKPWRTDVRAAARTARGDHPPLSGPLEVSLDFRLPRPKGHYGTGRNADALKPSAPVWPDKKPDLDKLIRAVLDALTGVVWHDDSQVVILNPRKTYATRTASPAVLPGVLITVHEA